MNYVLFFNFVLFKLMGSYAVNGSLSVVNGSAAVPRGALSNVAPRPTHIHLGFCKEILETPLFGTFLDEMYILTHKQHGLISAS